MSSVLVTGGSGFVGSHCIVQLLAAGHQVRTTLRNLSREPEVRAMVKAGGVAASDQLSFIAADLNHAAGWREAVAGCEYVLHVASPFPTTQPRNEDELILPAREGALRVLRAARDCSVKRVVLTSSFAAVGYGHANRSQPFTENDWTNPAAPDVQPYIKSKTLAERAAWDFMEREGGALELTVVNPTGIFGPVLGPDLSGSIAIIQRMLEGGMRFCPRIYFGVVDVRDVASLHLQAMTHPAARNQRFIAVAGDSVSLCEVGRILRHGLGPKAAKAPRHQLPDWLVRLGALRNSALKSVLPQLGKRRCASNEKARRLLGWAPRSTAEALLATAESLCQFNLIK